MFKLNSKQNIAAILLIVVLGVTIYFNSLFNPFIWDDTHLILKNVLVRNFSNFTKLFQGNIYYIPGEIIEVNYYRPLQSISYMLDYSLYGLKPFGYHLTNMLLHILNAILVYFLLFIITKKRSIAFISGLLFVAHPVHTQAVAYISTRADLLVGTFILLSTIFFVIYANYKRIRRNILYFLSILCFVLALLSKELAIILPLVLILYDFCFRKEIFVNILAFLKRYSAFILVDLIYIISRLTILDFSLGESAYLTGQYSLFARIIIFFHAFNKYLRILFLPLGLHMCRIFTLSLKIFNPITLLFILSFFLCLALLAYSYKKSKIIFFAGAWYLIMLLPQSGLYPIGAFMAEHFLYLPSIGFFLLISLFLKKYLTRKMLIIIMIMLIGSCSILTAIRNYEWRNPELFYKKTIKNSPYCFDAYINLAYYYYKEKGQFGEAEELLKTALRFNYNLHLTRKYLSELYILMGQDDEALIQLNEIVKIAPKLQKVGIYNNIGYLHGKRKSYDEAIKNYKLALEENPSFFNSRWNLANAYIKKGELKKGIKECGKILGIEDAILLQDRQGPSLKELIQVLKQQPNYTSAFTEFGLLFIKYQQFDIAEKIFRRVVELDPNNPEPYFNLGTFYYQIGSKKKAKIQWKRALKVDAHHLPSQEWLGSLQIQQKY